MSTESNEPAGVTSPCELGSKFMRRWIFLSAGLAIGLSTAISAGATERKSITLPVKSPAPAPTANAGAADSWEIRSIRKESGELDYCAAGKRFPDDHSLAVAGNAQNETMLILALPKGTLKPDTRLSGKISVDDKERRAVDSLATKSNVVLIPLGKDDAFFEALRRGNVLKVEIPEASATLALRGSGKALGELRTCIKEPGNYAVAEETPEKQTAEPPAPAPQPAPPQIAALPPQPAEAAAQPPVNADPPPAATPAPEPNDASAGASALGEPLPAPLVTLLTAAGMPGIVPVSLDKVPVDQRPANYAWRYGSVFGGIRETAVIDDPGLESLSSGYIQALKNSCPGEFSVTLGPLEPHKELTMRIGDASCRTGLKVTHFRHVYYVNKVRIFTVFIHEGDDSNREQATKARDAIAAVIRRYANP